MNKVKITDFLKSKTGTVELNSFLKSLYPVPKGNDKPGWTLPGEPKKAKLVLSQLVSEKLIEISENEHLRLGSVYYEGEQQYARIRDIGNTKILATYVGG